MTPQHEGYRDISPDEAAKVYATAPRRWGTAWYGPVPELEIEGRWLQLCRTDLHDNVATSKARPFDPQKDSLEEAVSLFAGLARLGARIGGGNFAAIDAYSDG